MEMRQLGPTGLRIAPLVFGGNVFGWTADEKTSFGLLDRFTEGGLNAIDTAEVYSRWVPGHEGGESETIIGRWFKARPSRRDQVVLITKVGADMGPAGKGLSAARIAAGVEGSLRRLQTDYIDLYLSHFPDEATSHEETLKAYDALIKAGKVRAIGCSNYNAEQLSAALAASAEAGLPAYGVLQPEYNLVARDSFEGALQDLCVERGIGVITYYSLASGFLSGKYRSLDDVGDAARGGAVRKYLNERGLKVLSALDQVAGSTGAKPAEVALAWLIAQRGVTAPIASATSAAQVDSLVRAAALQLSGEQLALLDAAGH